MTSTDPRTAAPPRRVRTVAFAGRPNAGKTSLIMQLTRRPQKPVNFPGSSVERTETHVVDGDVEWRAVDLPGISSLEPLTPDERAAVDYLAADADSTGRPDVICAVVDASKLSIELHLVRQLAQLGAPIVLALNKLDLAAKNGHGIDADALARELGVPVIATDGFRGGGTSALRDALLTTDEASAALAELDPDAVAAACGAPTATAATTPPTRRTFGARLDAVLLHRVLGLPLLAIAMFGTFQAVFTLADPFMGWIEAGQDAISGVVESSLDAGALRSFVIDGLINGVGSALVFLPQIALLIALVTVLEATGYMARAAFLLDRVLRGVGLSGRSFVPLASSFACAIPGVLASRIIQDERDRLATIVVSPLMSCSARLPVYVVLIGAFFPSAWAGLILFGLYVLGIVLAALVAWLLRRTVLAGGQSVFALELPSYQWPSVRVVVHQVWNACREFLRLAGTLIFATAIVIWLCSYYPRPTAIHDDFEARRAAVVATTSAEDPARTEALAQLDRAEDAAYFEQSWLARFGKSVQPAFAPAGFDWRMTVGVLSAFPARELIVPTLGILYSLGEVDAGEHDIASLDADRAPPDGLRAKLREAKNDAGESLYDRVVALALMVFFALCSQCMATLATIRRETHSWRWPVFTFVYMTALAWLAAVLVYQVGTALGFGGSP